MRLTALAAGLGALLLWPAVAHVAEDPVCPSVKLPPIALPHFRDAIHDGKTVRIVALGSSSTAGAYASDERHTYPALLEAGLDQALPQTRLEVVNRGVGGQDATEELARLDTDVLQAAPTLVIWQVGANGAMRNTDPAEFQRQVDTGVRKMEAAGADVILMDNQRSPAILASPEHAKLDQVLADVAKQDGARLFARGRLMEMWQEDGHPYAEFLAGDGVHHNDRGYACVARALASSMIEGLGGDGARLHAAQ